MKKSFISIVICIAMLFSLSVSAYAVTPSITESRECVSYVEELIYVDGELAAAYSGTCFFVGVYGEAPQYAVTNQHVVEEYLDYGKGDQVIMQDSHGQKHYVQAHLLVFFNDTAYEEAFVVDADESQDIAIIRLSNPTEYRKAMPTHRPTEEMVGEEVHIIGYPGVAQDTNNVSNVGPTDSNVTTATIGRLITRSGSGTKWIQYADTETGHGNSGGPMVYSDGCAVGLVARGIVDDDDKMYYGPDISSVEDMLNRNGIKYSTYLDIQDEEKSGLDIPLWVWIVVAAVIVGAAVAIALILSSKKKKEAELAKQRAMEAERQRAMEMERQRALNAERQKQAAAAAKSAAPKYEIIPLVRSLSVQHNGQALKIGRDPLSVGRELDNKLIFKADTPGVSAHHCTINWDPSTSEFVITDLKSSVGTFFENGSKLNPGVPYRVKPGDSIYLGYKENTLRMEIDRHEV